VTRRITMVLVLSVLIGGGVAAIGQAPDDKDEPPVRLEKKKKNPEAGKDEVKPPQPNPEQAKKDDKGKEEPRPDVPAEPQEDREEILNRILKNTRVSEERLANKEVGEPTQQLQRDILKDIDALIEENKRQQQQSAQNEPQGGGQGGQQQQGGAMSQNNGGRRQRNQMARGQRSQGQGEQQDTAQNGNNPGGGGTSKQDEAAKLADLYKDIWGHLPEALRAEMNSYSKEQFMDKYRDQLKRYYATVAEKGRKE
jgi:hypothetical protein